MRDCSKNRGFDRVLMAVAATFLTVSATSALAQTDPPRNSAAELAIDAAIPRPEPANVPPPTASDFKLDTTASVPDAAKADRAQATTEKARAKSEPKADEPKAAEPKPSDVVTAPSPPRTSGCGRRNAGASSPEPVKAASNVAPADQPVADKLRELIGAKASRYFDRKGERAAVEKFYTAREFAPLWTQAGAVTATAKGVIARLKDAAADGLNPADYPVPDFTAATTPDALAEAEMKLTGSMLDYARQAQSGRMHWSQVSADILYPEHPTDPAEVLANVTTAKDASAALEGYNPPHKLYRELKAKLAELRGQGEGPVVQIAEGPALAFKAATKKQPAVDAGRFARAAAARQARHHRQRRRHPLRRQGRRGRAQIPGKRRTQGQRRARRPHRQGDQQPEARPPDRHRDRQHGTLALAAAPARRSLAGRCLRHSQHPRFYAQGDAERRAGLDTPGW